MRERGLGQSDGAAEGQGTRVKSTQVFGLRELLEVHKTQPEIFATNAKVTSGEAVRNAVMGARKLTYSMLHMAIGTAAAAAVALGLVMLH